MAAADVLLIGAGPASLVIAAELVSRGLRVEGLAPLSPEAPWLNTYGIWGSEVDALGLASLLGHRWHDCRSWFGPEPTLHGHDYGLFDKQALQAHLLQRLQPGGVRWRQSQAVAVEHDAEGSTVVDAGGDRHRARLVIDASGHQPVFVRRPQDGPVAGQAAYGIVGRFSAPPLDPGQFVLMDYRPDHLSPEERRQPPTFLYAMDLGEGRFFVEETSLALAPAVSFAVLQQRLHQRLAHRGVRVEAVEHEEFGLFPMNPALPDRRQRVVGFGGAASMVHPASGYMVGGLLRRAPALATAIAAALEAPGGALRGQALAEAAWEALWPRELRRRHALHRFGLEKLMRFDEAQLRQFFATFFQLPDPLWYGFLSNTLPLPELLAAQLQLFARAPAAVRWGLMQPQGRELALLARMLQPD
ncbi:MAG: lycopene cyclase family protein [Synechococcaceae cyanobacterium]|nr:lycopene cyclase family protein [Synechococcaceae cyanobacterium]